ncbi:MULTISPECIES: IclR family transcriptional regulator [Fusobacterium]|uniref:IclR family transcriptional regulator n=1 Tax=Fusobacterium TaxID=848 RepID=UPI001476B5C7|nr:MULTISPECIES: IclR family transcriptional regulator [Fusobacterium]NME36810.1 IclR family transcriptional regulator [Fusobacterium sp. FSA-380-WT-3A]
MVQSLLKAIELLELLKKSEESCSIAQLSNELNIPPSTVHRILKTLCTSLYVVKDEKSHEYRLGPALIPLGTAASKHLHLQNIAHEVLKRIAAETGEDTFLIIPVEYKGIVLERIDGKRTLKLVEEFGDELYLHYGAIRKAILAFQTEDFINKYIKEVLDKGKTNLRITPLELREKLKKIRLEGVSTSSGDYAKGTFGIGAPIRNSSGQVIASLGVVVAKPKLFLEERIEYLKKVIKSSAQEISNKMGYF